LDADEYEKADSWMGKPTVLVAVPEPEQENARVTISNACQFFITNREAAGLSPATLGRYHTFAKQTGGLFGFPRLSHARADALPAPRVRLAVYRPVGQAGLASFSQE
jgi:hypothetical protein